MKDGPGSLLLCHLWPSVIILPRHVGSVPSKGWPEMSRSLRPERRWERPTLHGDDETTRDETSDARQWGSGPVSPRFQTKRVGDHHARLPFPPHHRRNVRGSPRPAVGMDGWMVLHQAQEKEAEAAVTIKFLTVNT